MVIDPFEKSLQQEQQALRQDVLNGVPTERYPERIDWLARYIALNEGGYMLHQPSGKQTHISRDNFNKATRTSYLSGLAEATGTVSYTNVLDKQYPLGSLIIQYAGLIEGLSRVDAQGVDPGEALGRLIARDVRRNSEGREISIASDFESETYTPRGLVEQILAHPELAETVKSVIPSTDAAGELVDQLGEVKVATPLWDHQLMALCEWLDHNANGYVNMATATGKTVLGLAAVAYVTDGGALHPTDSTELEERFGDDAPPQPSQPHNSDILVVTTDELLGVQWARLFSEHCNTPPAFTEIVDQTISLPWGDIDIRSANAVGDTDPSEYRLAIFDEVHNYASSSGWGGHLAEYIDSACPVLALTGSVSDEIERRFQQAESQFPCVYTYTHEEALNDGVVPDFDWTLQYTPIDKERSSTAVTLEQTVHLMNKLVMWDGSACQLDESATIVQSLPPEIKSDVITSHDSPAALARAILSIDNSDVPDELLQLANGISNRRTYWWNLRLASKPVIELVQSAMATEQPTLVLTRSYREGDQLFKQLHQACENIKIQKLDQGENPATHDRRIMDFDQWKTDRKVLIGPGDRIGTGNDIQSVEVGVNLAKPGTGMSNSLVQRLGRLLRQPNKKDGVDFYHLLGIPPVEAVAPIDGESFVRNAAGFFAQAKTADGSREMIKVPQINIADDVKPSVRRLEKYGATSLTAESGTIDGYEQAYLNAIVSASYDKIVIGTDWYSDLFDRETLAAQSSSQSLLSLDKCERSLEGGRELMQERDDEDNGREHMFNHDNIQSQLEELQARVVESSIDTDPMSLLAKLGGESEESSVNEDRFKWVSKDNERPQSGSAGQPTDGSNNSSAASKAQRVVHQLLIVDQSLLSDKAQTLAKTTTTEIHEFDSRDADIDDEIDTLKEIKSNLKELDQYTDGINTERLRDVRARVDRTLSKFETLNKTLVTANRKIVLVEQTMPAVNLLSVDKELENAISLAEELGRETTRFEDLQHGVGKYIKEIPAEKIRSHDGGEPLKVAENEASIQPNVISEYYDAVRNLRRLTSAIEAVVDDMDEPMQHWCDTVDAFMTGDMNGYPSYGKVHIERNGFTMAEYRDEYGDGSKTTEYHAIEVELLTETVQQLLKDLNEPESLSNMYLPVAPESKTRLPVIVETEAEVAQATSLLKELPKSFDPQNEGETIVNPPTGGPEETSLETLTEIGGITEDVATALRSAGVTSPEQLTEMQLDDLTEIDGVSPGTAQRIKMQTG